MAHWRLDSKQHDFRRYAEAMGLSVPDAILTWLFDRYRTEGRPMRGCEPRDLLERVRDTCRFRHIPLQLNEKTLNLAWSGYFGTARNANGKTNGNGHA